MKGAKPLTIIRPFKSSPADIETRQGLQQAGAKLLASYAALPAAMARLPNPRPFVRLVPMPEPGGTETGCVFLTDGQTRPALYERDLTPFWQPETWNPRIAPKRASGLKKREAAA